MTLAERSAGCTYARWRLGLVCLLPFALAACYDALGYANGDDPIIVPSDASAAAARAMSAAATPNPTDAGSGALGQAPGQSPLSPASPPLAATCLAPSTVAPCALKNGATLPDEARVEQSNTVDYFGGGAALPAGNYRVEYINGCLSLGFATDSGTYGPIFASVATFSGLPSNYFDALLAQTPLGWSVNFSTTTDTSLDGNLAVWLVQDGVVFMPAPGSPGTNVGGDAGTASSNFTTYAECVSANCVAPDRYRDFFFGGGTLGVRYGLTVPGLDIFKFISGTTQGGQGPTFRLTRLDPCN